MTDAEKAFNSGFQTEQNGECYYTFPHEKTVLIRTALKAQQKPVEVTVKEFNDLIDPLMPSFNNIGNLFLNKFPNGVKVVDGGEHG